MLHYVTLTMMFVELDILSMRGDFMALAQMEMCNNKSLFFDDRRKAIEIIGDLEKLGCIKKPRARTAA